MNIGKFAKIRVFKEGRKANPDGMIIDDSLWTYTDEFTLRIGPNDEETKKLIMEWIKNYADKHNISIDYTNGNEVYAWANNPYECDSECVIFMIG